MSEYTRTLSPIRWADEPKPAYDVLIIGGGGHGLSTAYHLATRHGITNVAVLEADYIASGNTGRTSPWSTSACPASTATRSRGASARSARRNRS